MQVKEYDLSLIDELKEDIQNTINEDIEVIPDLEPREDLIGISDSVYKQIEAAFKSGKRHIIFYGPPGTGKTTLAEYVAQEMSSTGDYEMLTASSSWTSQELIGGYQPIGGGKIGFVPGAILRNFDRPIVIDELNRCPIDKVIGPLFSVLSGQASTLPYKLDLEEDESPFHVIFPGLKENSEKNEWFPKREWRLIATLNTVDKSQLGQLSYALSRRFAWIKIGVPTDLDDFILKILKREDEKGLPNPLADLWSAINKIRQIGGAPIIDCIKTLKELDPGIDLLTEPDNHYKELLVIILEMYILPMLDGIRGREAEEFVNEISDSWVLSESEKSSLLTEMDDIIA